MPTISEKAGKIENRSVGQVSAKRIPELDGIRGLAILLVVLWHFVAVPMKPATHSGFAPIWTLLGVSWTGVDLFFVLSGFLIGGILLDNRESQNYFKSFYVRRVCRIFPIYYLLVFAYFAVALVDFGEKAGELKPLMNNPMPFWSYVTFTQNLVMTHKTTFGCGWLAMTWSLAIEEQFYLILPFVVRFVPRNRLPWVLLGGAILAPCMRWALLYFERRDALAAGYVMMPCRADALLLGVLGAYAIRSPEICERLMKHRGRLYAGFCVLLMGIIGIAIYSSYFLSYNVTFWGRSWLALFYLFLLMIPVVYREGFLAAIMRTALLRKLGLISYGVYLVHQIVLALTLAFLFPGTERTAAALALPTLVAFILTIALALALYQFIEKPIIRLGHQFRYK